MNRTQLRNMIESGRAVALDCYEIGKSIAKDDPVGKLFVNDILNKSVLLKRYEKSLPTARQPMIVSTLVYFPYDFKNPYEGGESLNYSDGGFHKALSYKISQDHPTEELLERIGSDMELLKLFHSMHSLDPFLFKSRAEQAEMDSKINDAYFAISPKEWDKIRLPIREKIARLVTMALGVSSGNDAEKLAREQYVERFLTKIWQAKDIEGIEPFVKAMQIPPERAPEVFFAWKAVCYYQVRFTEMAEKLRTMFQWVGHNELCFPIDYVRLSDDALDRIREKREMLRTMMREGYVAAHRVIREYEESYLKFVDDDKPQLFMNFLGNAENSYLGLAAHVSVATHSLNLWKWYVEQYGPQMRNVQFGELFDGLSMLYGVDAVNERLRGTAAPKGSSSPWPRAAGR
jgi:hypothetical protein